MAEFKVREVPYEEPKDPIVEKPAIEPTDEPTEEPSNEQEPIQFELDDDKVLSYFKEKKGKELSSLEELFEEKVIEKELELPEDVEAFFKYKKETGRSLNDFVKLNRDLDNESPDKLLAEYIRETNPEYDEEDVAFALEQFKFDEDLDDDATIRNAKLSKKKELAKAKEYFNQQKEQYKAPLESSSPLVPEEELESYNAYKEYRQSQEAQTEEQRKRSEFFKEKTESLFSDKFEGFKFKVNDDKEMTYKPGDVNALKENQMSLNNFVASFLDDNGYLKDAEAFHRAIAIASDPDKFARFFYEQGQTETVTSFEKEGKNVDMIRQGSPTSTKQGLKVRVVDNESSGRLKIKKR